MLCKIGEIEVWHLLDWQGLFLSPKDLFPNAPADVAAIMERLAPGTIDAATGRIILPVQAFLLKTRDHVILVDTGVGNDKSSSGLTFWDCLNDASLLDALGGAGVAPEDVDYVLFTHLHIDHVGWNTRRQDGAWVPTFPKATYLMPSADDEEMRDRGLATYEESIAPVFKAGQAELIDADHKIGAGISLLSTPGHTAGHVSVLLYSGGQEAVLTGDALHSTAQCQHPLWQFKFDWDPDMAVASRRTLLNLCVTRELAVIGSHFVVPSIGQIEADGDVYRWVQR